MLQVSQLNFYQGGYLMAFCRFSEGITRPLGALTGIRYASQRNSFDVFGFCARARLARRTVGFTVLDNPCSNNQQRHISFASASAFRRNTGTLRPDSFSFSRHIMELGPAELCLTAKRASVEVTRAGAKIWDDIEARLLLLVDDMSFRQVGVLMQSLALARRTGGYGAVNALCGRAVALLESVQEPISRALEDGSGSSREASEASTLVKPADALNLVKAMSRLKIVDSRLMNCLVPEFYKFASVMKPSDYVDVLVSYAHLNIRNKDLFALCARVLPLHVGDLSASSIAAVVSSFARVSMFHDHMFDSLANCVVERAENDSISLSNAIILLSGFTRIIVKLQAESAASQGMTRYKILLSHLLKPLERSSHELGFTDWLQVFRCLISVNYCDIEFIRGVLLPSLYRRFTETLLEARNMSMRLNDLPAERIEFRKRLLQAYSSLCEYLMRLPPMSTGMAKEVEVEVFRIEAAEAAVRSLNDLLREEYLLSVSKPLEDDQFAKALPAALRLLRALLRSETLQVDDQLSLLSFVSSNANWPTLVTHAAAGELVSRAIEVTLMRLQRKLATVTARLAATHAAESAWTKETSDALEASQSAVRRSVPSAKKLPTESAPALGSPVLVAQIEFLNLLREQLTSGKKKSQPKKLAVLKGPEGSSTSVTPTFRAPSKLFPRTPSSLTQTGTQLVAITGTKLDPNY